jgi:hypothetical protein
LLPLQEREDTKQKPYEFGVLLDNSLGIFSPQIENQKNQNNIFNQWDSMSH